ncbi:Smr/MutS family protein [uncultured Algimonas sp.]|uniref:Smr/MutS family protein n=1 Tax=uncultured Algimonas sp. TaxID=1547920 RepID=UPI00260E40B8|nr:Smr/MutS family protein [uncultured Algimonas sp.]
MSRRLDETERLVWNRVARTVRPRRRPHGKGAAKPEPSATRDDFAAMMRLPPLRMISTPAPNGPVPRNADKSVRKGRVEIDRRLDLHGLTRSEARRTLSTALFRSAKRGERCLLVITGKGPDGAGVLRTSLREWLRAPDLWPLVATYAQAHARHGGSGAWYVFLRA